jgi:hypothetical protein
MSPREKWALDKQALLDTRAGDSRMVERICARFSGHPAQLEIIKGLLVEEPLPEWALAPPRELPLAPAPVLRSLCDLALFDLPPSSSVKIRAKLRIA